MFLVTYFNVKYNRNFELYLDINNSVEDKIEYHKLTLMEYWGHIKNLHKERLEFYED